MLTNQLKTIYQQVFTFVIILVFQMLSSHFKLSLSGVLHKCMI